MQEYVNLCLEYYKEPFTERVFFFFFLLQCATFPLFFYVNHVQNRYSHFMRLLQRLTHDMVFKKRGGEVKISSTFKKHIFSQFHCPRLTFFKAKAPSL